jgi:ABC-type Fe3+-hydroxamate transport system substrate-binding protein
MKTFFRVVTPFALVLSLGACSSNDSAADTTIPSAATPTDPTDSKMAAPTEVSVIVGTDSSPDRIEEVALGANVQVMLSNPQADDEFHLHGYDLSPGETKMGEASIISFTADKAGDFEIESHVTEDVLVIIRVK